MKRLLFHTLCLFQIILYVIMEDDMLMLSPDDNDLNLVNDVNMALLDDSDEELGGGMKRMNIKTTTFRPAIDHHHGNSGKESTRKYALIGCK